MALSFNSLAPEVTLIAPSSFYGSVLNLYNTSQFNRNTLLDNLYTLSHFELNKKASSLFTREETEAQRGPALLQDHR